MWAVSCCQPISKKKEKKSQGTHLGPPARNSLLLIEVVASPRSNSWTHTLPLPLLRSGLATLFSTSRLLVNFDNNRNSCRHGAFLWEDPSTSQRLCSTASPSSSSHACTSSLFTCTSSLCTCTSSWHTCIALALAQEWASHPLLHLQTSGELRQQQK